MALAWAAPGKEFSAHSRFGTKLIATIERSRSRLNPSQILAEYSRRNPHFWTPAESEYPRLLLETPSPPPILHYRGQVRFSRKSRDQKSDRDRGDAVSYRIW